MRVVFWKGKVRAKTLGIIDSCRADELVTYLSIKDYFVINIRKEVIYFVPICLAILRYFFAKKNLPLTWFYIAEVIKFLGLKQVISFQDNNPVLYRLKTDLGLTVKVFVIQNAWRSYAGDLPILWDQERDAKREIDVFFGFNESIVGYYIERVNCKGVVVGSLKCAHFNRDFLIRDYGSHENIAYISQVERLVDDHKLLCPVLRIPLKDSCITDFRCLKIIDHYCFSRNLSLSIIMRSDRDEEGRLYSALRLRSRWDLVPRKSLFSSYQAMFKSAAVVCTDSTLGYESLSLGLKTFFVSARDKQIGTCGFQFGWPSELGANLPFTLDSFDQHLFDIKLTSVLNMSVSDWHETVESCKHLVPLVRDAKEKILQEIGD